MINLNPILPLRSAPDEGAEMWTHLLFGEPFTVEEDQEHWLRIHTVMDDYRGWIDRKMATPITANEWQRVVEEKPTEQTFVSEILATAYISQSNQQIYLPCGSRIPFYKPNSQTFSVGGIDFSIEKNFVCTNPQPMTERAVSVAKSFLNAPYLWGGRTILGIDCSGLTSIVMRLCGVNIPRDAKDQALFGKTISSLNDALAGDLAFFTKDGKKITHVGMLLSTNKIIHASGKVKIETIDSYGIISSITGKYTHQLCGIKRVL